MEMDSSHDKVLNNKVLRDIVITELEKYHKMLLEQGLDEQEKVHELIGILKEDNNNRDRIKTS